MSGGGSADGVVGRAPPPPSFTSAAAAGGRRGALGGRAREGLTPLLLERDARGLVELHVVEGRDLSKKHKNKKQEGGQRER